MKKCGLTETRGGWVGGDFCPQSFLAAAPGAGRRHAPEGFFLWLLSLMSDVVGMLARGLIGLSSS